MQDFGQVVGLFVSYDQSTFVRSVLVVSDRQERVRRKLAAKRLRSEVATDMLFVRFVRSRQRASKVRSEHADRTRVCMCQVRFWPDEARNLKLCVCLFET